MKICVICVGSHGDMRPYIALGVGLKNQGFDVCLASHQKAEDLCGQFNLEFRLIEGDLTDLRGSNNSIFEDVGGNKLKLALAMVRAFKSTLEKQLQTSLQAVQDADIIIYGPAVFAVPHIGEATGIPIFRLMMQPEIRTHEHPSIFFANQKLGKSFNFASHLITEQLFWHPVRRNINNWRRSEFGLKKLPCLGPAYDHYHQTIPTLVAFSPLLMPQPGDWPSHIRMTNFCRLPEGKNWQPPASLQKFLEAGSLPIYLGFGSMTKACPSSIVVRLIEVLKESKVRTIIHGSLPGLFDIDLPSFIYPLHYAPHDWLFPRMAAVVHHGGVGTTAAGLYAGKPTLTLPFMADQYLWNQRIAALKIGPLGFSIKQLTKERFSKCLHDLLHNPHYQVNAQKLSQAMLNEEDGVELTIRTIKSYIETHSR